MRGGRWSDNPAREIIFRWHFGTLRSGDEQTIPDLPRVRKPMTRGNELSCNARLAHPRRVENLERKVPTVSVISSRGNWNSFNVNREYQQR